MMMGTGTYGGTNPSAVDLTGNSPPFFCPACCGTFTYVRWVRQILLPLFLSVTLVVASLTVCNAHASATEHPDCVQCLAASLSRREDGMPMHLPAGPHHCPDHPCMHLHASFLVESSTGLPPLLAVWFFFSPLTLQGQELPLILLRPPQA